MSALRSIGGVFAEMQRSADVIIVGGGVAGLAAAGALSRQRVRVILIEARERLGGRVFTVRPPGWRGPVELGAQFVHGGNQELWRLLKKHDIRTEKVAQKHWYFGAEDLVQLDDVEKRIANVTGQIDEKRMAGWSFAKFMREKGADFSAVDRELAEGFVEGFEAAPGKEMSAIAVAGETLDDDEQYLVPGGYDQVIHALVAELQPYSGVMVLTQTPCTAVQWRKGFVEVRTPRGRFTAPTVVMAVPLGVLQARRPQRGAIEFRPLLRAHAAVAAKMRMGQVVRITLRFNARRWRGLLPPRVRAAAEGGFGFIHSHHEGVPVWWSLKDEPVLTGWAGGPAAVAMMARSTGAIKETALRTLSRVLAVSRTTLAGALEDSAMHAWGKDPFARGAYSFTRVGQEGAPERLRQAWQNTLFFAGEATADGAAVGTVHGALASGLRAAGEVATVLGAQGGD